MKKLDLNDVIISDQLVRDENTNVYFLKGRDKSDYSDYSQSERFLQDVISRSVDLGSDSIELEEQIVDRDSEYHLSTKRTQLLRGFEIDRTLRTLELGCGCGAITRFLGENLDDVISVEANPVRARIAGLRTADLDSVSVVCAPFQEIEYTCLFDLIVCIGFFEYSAAFVNSENPYEDVIARFAELLTPKGQLIIAIGNRFGLKYFNGSNEDHLSKRFEGIEGYPIYGDRVRTFGRLELREHLSTHFTNIDFLYPYPDYKMPDCVLSHEFLCSKLAGELVAGISSRDYSDDGRRLWDEPSVIFGANENGLLPDLANSFLVVASKATSRGFMFKKLGVFYNVSRRKRFRTCTSIVQAESGEITASKTRMYSYPGPFEMLDHCIGDSTWQNNLSVASVIRSRSRSGTHLDNILAPAVVWAEYLKNESTNRNERAMLNGGYIDATWSNAYIDNSNNCKLVDQEWKWCEDIPLNVVVIRSIVCFLRDNSRVPNLHPSLRDPCGRRNCIEVARTIGITLSPIDFTDYIALQSELDYAASGAKKLRIQSTLRMFMINRRFGKTLRMLSVFSKRYSKKYWSKLFGFTR